MIKLLSNNKKPGFRIAIFAMLACLMIGGFAIANNCCEADKTVTDIKAATNQITDDMTSEEQGNSGLSDKFLLL